MCQIEMHRPGDHGVSQQVRHARRQPLPEPRLGGGRQLHGELQGRPQPAPPSLCPGPSGHRPAAYMGKQKMSVCADHVYNTMHVLHLCLSKETLLPGTPSILL